MLKSPTGSTWNVLYLYGSIQELLKNYFAHSTSFVELFSQLGQEEVREFPDQLLIYKELEYIDDNICQILYLY